MILTHETLLSPKEHTIRIEAILQDCKHVLTPNYYGEYRFSFVPAETTDLNRLFEAGERAFTEVALNTPHYMNFTGKKCFEDEMGQPYCSQLSAPVINEEVMHPLRLLNRTASLTLHFRDGTDGNLYLFCDYIDLYDEANGFIDYRYPPEPGELVDETDW